MGKRARLQIVAKIDSKTIEEYQKVLAEDPNSKVFAVLGEAYRELGIFEQAENILRRGISKHPQYAAGYLVLAKIFIQKKDNEAAIKLLSRAVELSQDNLLGYQLLGETHLQMKNHKEALKAYKMALFLNPTQPRALQVVHSLEKLSADEYEDELFSMQAPGPLPETTSGGLSTPKTDTNFDRVLSLVDALIVRQQPSLARKRLVELQKLYPGNPDIESRFEMLEAEEEIEQAEPIRPIATREKRVINEKIQRLKRVLRALEVRLDVSP